jgi:hypothetical protein
MGLLLADLQGLCNGLRGDGRTGLAGRLLPPLLLGGLHWVLGTFLLQHGELLQLLHRRGDPVQYLCAHALAPGPIVAGWIGFALAQRQLFEAPELVLWQSAPLRAGRAALQVLLRSSGTAVLWAAALILPLSVQLLLAGDAPCAAYGWMLVALLAAVVPPLCCVLALQIVLLSAARGRAARWLLSLASALAAFGFPVFLLAQVFAGGQGSAGELAEQARGGATGSPLTAGAARLLAEALGGPVSAGALLAVAVPTVVCLLLALAAARLHGSAVQNHQLAAPVRRGRLARWPADAAAVVWRKELAQLMQQPGSLLHMLLVGAVVHVFAAQGTLVRGVLAGGGLPPPVPQCAGMLTLWFLAVLMLLYTHMGRLAASDGAQWPLYMAAPLSPRTLLRAKLQVIALLLLWPLFVSGWAGVQWLDAGLDAMLVYGALATAGSLAALAVVAAVGTWPWLLRTELDGRLSQGSRGLVGSMVLVLTFYLALLPAFLAWAWLLAELHAQPPDRASTVLAESWPVVLPSALGLGAALLGAALLVGSRQYRHLLAPR